MRDLVQAADKILRERLPGMEETLAELSAKLGDLAQWATNIDGTKILGSVIDSATAPVQEWLGEQADNLTKAVTGNSAKSVQRTRGPYRK